MLIMVIIFCHACGDDDTSNTVTGTESEETSSSTESEESDSDDESEADDGNDSDDTEDNSTETESDDDEEDSTGAGSSGNGIVEIALNGDNYLVMAQDITHTLTWDEAVATCKNLSLNGYTGWHLPSKAELVSMYKRKGTIGGFSDAWYWSSTETNDYNALQQDFGDGKQNAYAGKGGEARVRCLRTM